MLRPSHSVAIVLLSIGLAACNGSKSPGGGGNVAMRDMEVVDGTANDAMTDLDNVAVDGTALDNASGADSGTGANAIAADAAPANGAAPSARQSPSGPSLGGNASRPD